MFTNYDGSGSGFGDTLVKSENSNDDISVYSSTDGENGDTVKIIVTSRSIHDDTPVEINVASDSAYESAEVYSLHGDSAEIRSMPAVEKIEGNSFGYVIPPLSVTEFVIKKPAQNASDNERSDMSDSVKPSGTKTVLPVIAGIAGVGAAAAALAVVIKKKRR